MLSDGFRATTKAGGYGSLLSQGRHEAHFSLNARISWSLSGFSKYDSERSPGGAKRNPGFRAMRRRPRGSLRSTRATDSNSKSPQLERKIMDQGQPAETCGKQ